MSGDTRPENGAHWGSAARSDDARDSESRPRSQYDPHSAREEAEHLVASVLTVAAAAARGFGGERASGERVWGARSGPSAGGPEARPRPGFATGTAECCVCPLCRVIAAMRDPDPEFAERVATGAGDLAASLASLLRSLGEAAPRATPGHRGDAGAGSTKGTGVSNGTAVSNDTGKEAAAGSGTGARAEGAGARTGRPAGGPWPWSEFTRPRTDGERDADDPWRAATRGTGPSGPPSQGPPSQGTKPMAKKAVKPRATVPSSYVEPLEPYAE